MRKQDIKKTKDATKLEIRVHKPPAFITKSQPTLEALDTSLSMALPLATIVPQEILHLLDPFFHILLPTL